MKIVYCISSFYVHTEHILKIISIFRVLINVHTVYIQLAVVFYRFSSCIV